MLPWHFFWTEHNHGKNRWTMCASDICFTNELFRCAMNVRNGYGSSNRVVEAAADIRSSRDVGGSSREPAY
jgi:hypothetical protein